MITLLSATSSDLSGGIPKDGCEIVVQPVDELPEQELGLLATPTGRHQCLNVGSNAGIAVGDDGRWEGLVGTEFDGEQGGGIRGGEGHKKHDRLVGKML